MADMRTAKLRLGIRSLAIGQTAAGEGPATRAPPLQQKATESLPRPGFLFFYSGFGLGHAPLVTSS